MLMNSKLIYWLVLGNSASESKSQWPNRSIGNAPVISEKAGVEIDDWLDAVACDETELEGATADVGWRILVDFWW